MDNFIYRVWGRPNWLTTKFPKVNWTTIGCLATERRSVASLINLSKFSSCICMIKIVDPLPASEVLVDKAYQNNLSFFTRESKLTPKIIEAELKASLDRILEIIVEYIEDSENIILDITSFPKRWFFPIVRFLLENKQIKNLQIVYTKGQDYADILHENPETLRVIPSFPCLDDRQKHDFAFVGVGFQTQSMLTMFGENEAVSLQMLFPFPPGPPGIRRNWKFIEGVERIVEKDDMIPRELEKIRYLLLDSIDVSHAFDVIRLTTDNADKTCLMAPYGPKPFSLAMCLYALAADAADKPDVPIYYSQPQRYAIDYTRSEALHDSELDSWAYAIKRDSKIMYKL